MAFLPAIFRQSGIEIKIEVWYDVIEYIFRGDLNVK